MKQFDKVRGAFRPQRTDDLRPGMAEFVGLVMDFDVMWVIEDGPYAGTFALWAIGAEGMGWIPQCDFEEAS